MSKYQGEHLNKISFPLGGIGSGCIGLSGHGELIDWEIFNRPNKYSLNGYSHIAVRAMDGKKVKDARALVSDRDISATSRNDMHEHTLQGFPHFENNTFEADFPLAKLVFSDAKFPGEVKLTAFNPLIPLESDNSSIPAAFFEVEFFNPTDKKLTYEAVFSVKNPFPASENKAFDNAVLMLDASNNENNLCIMTDAEERDVCDYWYRGWFRSFYRDDLRTYWNEFSGGEALKCRKFPQGSFDMCSLSAGVCLESGERKKVRFVLSWSIPYGTHYWRPVDENVKWKNYYATKWENAFESAKYSLEHWDYLYEKTEEFAFHLYSCTLPESFKQAISSGLSVLKSPTVLRFEDGSLYGWEGAEDFRGSCEGLCQHVWSYAYVCCYLFPDLEMSIRKNYLKYGIFENGEMPFRLPVPFDSEFLVNMFANNGKKFMPALDGQMGEVIKIYREWKLSGDNDWIRAEWENIKKILMYAYSPENQYCWDANKDGVLEGRQHHTLDIELFGASAWLEGFYLAALKAGAEMAHALSDYDAEKEFTKLFESGYKYTEKELFNGKYFIQKIDVKDKSVIEKFNCDEIFWNEETQEISHQIADGCLIDQLCAQWHADLCGLGRIFDEEQAKIAVKTIYDLNFKISMRDIANPWRIFATNGESGTVMCEYPDDIVKPKNPIPYCEEVMSGFEYSLAGLLMENGYMQEAENVVSAVRERYNGKNRNPFNDVEFGSNYARSMAAFALIPLSSGFCADMVNKTVTFCPTVAKRPFKSIWAVPSGWGTFEINGDELTIAVLDGNLELNKIKLPFINDVISSNCENVEFDGGYIKIRNGELHEKLVLKCNFD